jgi:monoamine oxidase
VTGGNDLVAAELAKRLPAGTTTLRSSLVAVRSNSDRSVTCTFDQDGSIKDVVADHVILALPFTTLRRVDLSRAHFSPRMMRAIREYGMGTNSKLHLQFRDRVWYRDHLDGDTFSDTGYQETWETDAGTPVRSGVLVNYTGGSVGAGYGDVPAHGPAPTHVVRQALHQMEPVIPGVEAAWNGTAYLDFWAKDPWHLGSYSCLTVGQYTAFGGYAQVRQGNVHFAGEHTSYEFQGFMNGAVASGERAAREIPARSM